MLTLCVLFDRPIEGAEGRLDERAVAAAAGEIPTAEAVARHRAHVRLLGGEGAEREQLLRLRESALPWLERPEAIAVFTGRAVTLAAEAVVRLRRPVPAVELWVAVRRFHLADAAGCFLDTLGMAEFGLPDLECYAGEAAEDTAAWLRNLSLYLVQEGAPIRSGDTLDGPDEQAWCAEEDRATVDPARRVIRFAPMALHP